MSEFELQRLGLMMKPEPGNPLEVEGVLNPAVVRGPDSQLYLFPRLVARGNYSRIGIARVRFNEAGNPTGSALHWSRKRITSSGRTPAAVARIRASPLSNAQPLRDDLHGAFVQPPRIALALSEDLFCWQRLGLATFRPYRGIEFDGVDNKDASIFPVAIPDPSGQPAMAILYRPLFSGTRPEETAWHPALRGGGFPSGKHLDLLLLNENGGL